ncbi:MAG: hypothetical protein ABSB96_09135 [Gaiellaceae bacterium]
MTTDVPEPSRSARWIALGLFSLAIAIALVVAVGANYARRAFQVDTANFALFAAFYAVTQGTERLLEILSMFIPPRGTDAQAKADRAIVMLAVAMLAGVGASLIFGLYFLRAIGVDYGHTNEWERAADVIVTALIISGGTKPLHDLIKLIEKARTT